MPYTVFDFTYQVLVGVTIGLILMIIAFLVKKAMDALKFLKALNDRIEKDQTRIDEIEKRLEEFEET
jgi:hypothetical protein